jgi:glycerophosphoryl diester phosphodiesterase
LRRCWPTHLPPPLLSSFKDASLGAAREAAPEFERALLISERVPDWRQRAEAVAAAGLNVDGKKLGTLWAHEIKQAGFVLGAYTINEAAEARASSRWASIASSPTRRM